MKVLTDRTAARLARLLAKCESPAAARAVRRSGPSAPSSRLFDLCFKQPPDGEHGTFGIYLFVGRKEDDAASLADAVRVNGRAVDCAWPASLWDWNPDSPWQRIGDEYNAAPTNGTAVWIVFGLHTESWSSRKWGDAANGGASGDLVWEPVVGTLASPPDYSNLPSGAAKPHYLHPVLVGFWKDGVGLVQCHAGPVEITVEVPDTDAAGTAVPERKSLERASDATLAVRGWTDPEACPSLALTGTDGKAAAGASDNSLLVRSSLSAGDSIRMRYLSFAALLAALDRRYPRKDSGDGDGDDLLDPLSDLISKPCPIGHDRTTPLVIYWNPCDLEDDQGNVLQPAGWQQGQFWPTGGNASQCKGSSIGDSNGNVVINQDTRTLTGGTWNFATGFSVQNVPFVRKNLSVDGYVRVDVLATTAPSGTIPSLASHEALTNLAARVSAAENSLSGLETLLSQI